MINVMIALTWMALISQYDEYDENKLILGSFVIYSHF